MTPTSAATAARFGSDGHPTRDVATAAVTVFESAAEYVAVHWSSWGDSQRSKVRGRLLVVIAVLLDDAAAGERVVAALERQARNRGPRPTPRTREDWVARYLRDHGLDPHQPGTELAGELLEARRWLEQRSMPLDELDHMALVRVRRFLTDTRPHGTARTYWSVIKAWIRWSLKAGRLVRDPLLALPDIARDLDAEAVDPENIPSEQEGWDLATAFGDRYGLWARTLVLLMVHLATRIGEVAALRRCDIEFVEGRGAWITVRRQDGRVECRYSDTGSTRRDDSPKGRTSGPGARRRIYVKRRVAEVVRLYLETLDDAPDTRLFTGVRADWLDPDAFRRERWAPVVAGMFPAGHRLHGIRPHSCRHAGMTMWLRAGVRLKIIQQWGGWHSLKVMLDTYAAVIPDDHADAMHQVDGPTSGPANNVTFGTDPRAALEPEDRQRSPIPEVAA